ncbi:molybdate ABC transporter permease subunit [Thermodesulfobacteriota bacterium]
MDWAPIFISAKLATITTIVLVVVTAPLACFFAYSRFRGKSLCEAVINLPLVLPPTVLGFYLLYAMNPDGLLGRIWEWLTGGRLVFSFSGIVLASMIYSLPFAYQPLKAAFIKVDKRLVESAYVLGLSPISTFFRVIVPSSVSGFVASAILVFVHTLGEFGVILMVGGSIPGRTKVVSIAIYEAVETLQYREALMMSAILIPICYCVLLVVNMLSMNKNHGT